MTAEDLYASLGASYSEALETLHSERIINKYIVKFPEEPTYGQLLEARRLGDTEQIFRCAHTFKGVCLNLALSNVAVYAAKITEHYRPGSVNLSDDIEGDFAKLDEVYNKTVKQIELFASQI